MVGLRVLALFHGLLCLAAASPANKRSVQDDDYALVRDAALQFFGEREDAAARKAQEKEDLHRDQNVREFENPKLVFGLEDDNSDESLPVVEDRLAPDTVKEIGEDSFLPFEFPSKAKEPEFPELSFEPEEKKAKEPEFPELSFEPEEKKVKEPESPFEPEEKTGNLLPAAEENVAPEKAKKDWGADEDDVLRLLLAKYEIGERNQKVETAQQEILTQNDIRQDDERAQKENEGERDFAEERKNGESNADKVEWEVPGGNVKEIDDTEENNKRTVAGRYSGINGNEKETVGLEEQDEKPNDVPLSFVGISHTEFWYPPVYEDNEQEKGQQYPVDRKFDDYNETINGLEVLGRELFVMSILMRRMTKMFLNELIEPERNESARAEENKEDAPKLVGILVEEDELLPANKEKVADEIGSPKKEVGSTEEVEFAKYKDLPSYYNPFIPNPIGIPEDKENVYVNNENMANGVIYPVKQEAYSDTFEHFMSKMDAGHEDTFYHQMDKRPSRHEDNFNHQMGKVRTGHEDIFRPQTDKMRSRDEDTYHQMEKRPSGHEDTLNHQADKVLTGHEDVFKPQTGKMHAKYEDTFYPQMGKRPSVHEDTSNHQMNKVLTGQEDIFEPQTGKSLAGNKDDREDLEEKDSKQETDESGESLGVQDFLIFLGNLLVGEDGESMSESGDRKPVNDITELKSGASDIGSSDAEAEELDEARERAFKLHRI